MKRIHTILITIMAVCGIALTPVVANASPVEQVVSVSQSIEYASAAPMQDMATVLPAIQSLATLTDAAAGGGTNCLLVKSYATACASSLQGASGVNWPYGKVITPLNRPTVSSAYLYVEFCYATSTGGCGSLVLNGRQKFDITSVMNAKKCSTITRGAYTNNGSCQVAGKSYQRQVGKTFVTKTYMVINGVATSSVVSPTQRNG